MEHTGNTIVEYTPIVHVSSNKSDENRDEDNDNTISLDVIDNTVRDSTILITTQPNSSTSTSKKECNAVLDEKKGYTYNGKQRSGSIDICSWKSTTGNASTDRIYSTIYLSNDRFEKSMVENGVIQEKLEENRKEEDVIKSNALCIVTTTMDIDTTSMPPSTPIYNNTTTVTDLLDTNIIKNGWCWSSDPQNDPSTLIPNTQSPCSVITRTEELHADWFRISKEQDLEVHSNVCYYGFSSSSTDSSSSNVSDDVEKEDGVHIPERPISTKDGIITQVKLSGPQEEEDDVILKQMVNEMNEIDNSEIFTITLSDDYNSHQEDRDIPPHLLLSDDNSPTTDDDESCSSGYCSFLHTTDDGTTDVDSIDEKLDDRNDGFDVIVSNGSFTNAAATPNNFPAIESRMSSTSTDQDLKSLFTSFSSTTTFDENDCELNISTSIPYGDINCCLHTLTSQTNLSDLFRQFNDLKIGFLTATEDGGEKEWDSEYEYEDCATAPITQTTSNTSGYLPHATTDSTTDYEDNYSILDIDDLQSFFHETTITSTTNEASSKSRKKQNKRSNNLSTRQPLVAQPSTSHYSQLQPSLRKVMKTCKFFFRKHQHKLPKPNRIRRSVSLGRLSNRRSLSNVRIDSFDDIAISKSTSIRYVPYYPM